MSCHALHVTSCDNQSDLPSQNQIDQSLHFQLSNDNNAYILVKPCHISHSPLELLQDYFHSIHFLQELQYFLPLLHCLPLHFHSCLLLHLLGKPLIKKQGSSLVILFSFLLHPLLYLIFLDQFIAFQVPPHTQHGSRGQNECH